MMWIKGMIFIMSVGGFTGCENQMREPTSEQAALGLGIVEGTKGGPTRQWEDNSYETYRKIDAEAQRRTLDFIQRNAKAGKPFYVANWPMMSSCFPAEI